MTSQSQIGIAIPGPFSNPGISGLRNANPGINPGINDPGMDPGIDPGIGN